MKPIVVVGSMNMDLVSRSPRIPKPGETVTGTDFQTYSGGKGANQAVAVARLEHPVVMLGAVGQDEFGKELKGSLQGFGVNTDHIITVPGASGTASITVDDQGENSIIVTPGANRRVLPAYLETKRELLQSAALVLTQLEVPLETIEWLSSCCGVWGVPLMLDPAPAVRLNTSLFANVTWFTPNESEAIFYADPGEDEDRFASRLIELGVRNVVLKRGGDGSRIRTSTGELYDVPTFKVDVVDTTAAGDTYNGAFAVAISKGQPVADAARYASAAAAISVSRKGAQPSMPSHQEVAEFLRTR